MQVLIIILLLVLMYYDLGIFICLLHFYCPANCASGTRAKQTPSLHQDYKSKVCCPCSNMPLTPITYKVVFHYVLRFAHAAKYHSHTHYVQNCIFSMCYVLPIQQNTTHTPIMYKVVFSVCVMFCPYSKIPFTHVPIMYNFYKVVFSVCVTFCPCSKIPLTHPLCTKLYFQYVLQFAHTAKYHSHVYLLCIKLYFQYVLHFAHAAKYHSHTHYVKSCSFTLCCILRVKTASTVIEGTGNRVSTAHYVNAVFRSTDRKVAFTLPFVHFLEHNVNGRRHLPPQNSWNWVGKHQTINEYSKDTNLSLDLYEDEL